MQALYWGIWGSGKWDGEGKAANMGCVIVDVLLRHISCGETLECCKHTIQNYPCQGLRELGCSYPHTLQSLVKGCAQGRY